MTGIDDAGDGVADRKAPSPAVDRALTVLETLVSSDEPLTLTALAQATGVPLATCAAIARTLELRGYAARRVVGRSHFWRPTLRINGLAAQLVKKVDIVSSAQPFLRRLVDATGMPGHVGILEGSTVIYVAKVAAPGMVQYDTYPGKASPFNLTALGRAIAAYLPEDQLTPLLDHLAQGRGPKARPATRKVLLAELAKVREQGYAVEEEEEDAGIGCVAAPFFGTQGAVAGSLGVTGFADQLRSKGFDAVAEIVTAQAESLARELRAGSVRMPFGD